MYAKIGQVIEVFIPSKYKKGQLINQMDSTLIGFKVRLNNNEVIEIIQEQNEFNSNILKEDKVLIVEQIISNTKFIDIVKYTGEEDE